MLLLSEKLMSCAAGTNGCLDLRWCASALDGRVSADWSRCLGSMARCPRDSVAPLRRSSAGWMPARIGRLFADVGPGIHGHPQKFFQGGKRLHFAALCQVADDAMQTEIHETLYRFYTTTTQRKRPMLRQQSQKMCFVGSNS